MIVQLQNLFRGAIKDPDNAIAAYRTRSLDWIRALYSPRELMKVFASTVRGMLIPAEGHDFIALDYAGIESRVIAWIYGETWKLKAFHIQDTEGGPDNYEYAYANTFKVPVESVNADQRQIGKPIDLGLGFQGGVGAFTTMAKTYKVDLNLLADMAFNKLEPHFLDKARWNFEKGYTSGHDLPEKVVLACDAIKHAWREAHPKIVQGWSDTDTAARAAVASPGEVFGISNKKLMFKVVGRWLYMRLPSGRKLAYYMPRLEQDGSVTFMGLDTDTRRWQRCKTYGGFWVQNSTQAIANDLLRAAILRWEAASYWVVGSVHDEGIMEVPEGWGSIEEAKQIMCDSPAWAKGLPVVAEGWRAKRYKK
jgi:DNA polymerase